MNDDAIPVPPQKPTGNPPPPNPDIWLAVITAAMQMYVHLGTVTGPVTTATISSVLEEAQNHQIIPPSAAALVLDLVQTPEGAALVASSAALATSTFTYIHAQAATSMTPDQPRTFASPTDDEAAAADPTTPEQNDLPS